MKSAHAPIVTDIRYTIDRDWTGGGDAIHFLIIVRDREDGHNHPIDTLLALEHELYDHVRANGTMRLPYSTFRLASEQRAGGDDLPRARLARRHERAIMSSR